jgi:5' nucleotidase family
MKTFKPFRNNSLVTTWWVLLWSWTTTTTTTLQVSAFLHTRTAIVSSTLRPPSFSVASTTTSTSSIQQRMTPRLQSVQSGKSSVEVDSDEDSEQRLGDESPMSTTTAIRNGVIVNSHRATAGTSRFDDLLESVGLDGKLQSLGELPPERKVSVRDIFCNRELKMSNIKAIGFDMDYTLAQYQQPAFDQLAFDGAKEKLVHKLGYPEQVLEFEYDHEVSSRTLEQVVTR